MGVSEAADSAAEFDFQKAVVLALVVRGRTAAVSDSVFAGLSDLAVYWEHLGYSFVFLAEWGMDFHFLRLLASFRKAASPAHLHRLPPRRGRGGR